MISLVSVSRLLQLRPLTSQPTRQKFHFRGQPFLQALHLKLPIDFSPESPAHNPPSCLVCDIQSSGSCPVCDEDFCGTHLYLCADCNNQYCGNCFDDHHADGHWADADTAAELSRAQHSSCKHAACQCRAISISASNHSHGPSSLPATLIELLFFAVRSGGRCLFSDSSGTPGYLQQCILPPEVSL